VKKYQDKSVFDQRKVKNNAIYYRLPIGSSSPATGIVRLASYHIYFSIIGHRPVSRASAIIRRE